jgi:tRNA-specific adenosine deaminase 1
MKCLPSSKLRQAQGNVLHDWHAETLAIRAFNRFVLDECQALASGSKSSSEFIRRRSSAEVIAAPTTTPDSVNVNHDDGNDGIYWHGQPFAWREDVLLHMYCSEAPCKRHSKSKSIGIV